jgi:hypothetical protein
VQSLLEACARFPSCQTMAVEALLSSFKCTTPDTQKHILPCILYLLPVDVRTCTPASENPSIFFSFFLSNGCWLGVDVLEPFKTFCCTVSGRHDRRSPPDIHRRPQKASSRQVTQSPPSPLLLIDFPRKRTDYHN